MKQEQEAHLSHVIDVFIDKVEKKYRKGQREHGGNLWEKMGIIDCAIEEALDQVVYLVTLKDQLDSGNYYFLKKIDKDKMKEKVKARVKKNAK